MKLKSKKRHQDNDNDDDSPSMGSASWMIKDRERLRKEQKRSDALAQRNRRPPELWISDGEERNIRFRTNEPVGVWRYAIKHHGRFMMVTMPPVGEVDLFKKAGQSPSLRYYYEVIDLTGYKDKKTGKRIKNVARFLPVSGRTEKQLEKMRQKVGDLRKHVYEISRFGSGQDTVYVFTQGDKEPLTEEQKKIERLMPEFQKIYAPPSKEEQKLLLAGVIGADDEEEDDDE